jgi:type 1 glutamine amidotransferase
LRANVHWIRAAADHRENRTMTPNRRQMLFAAGAALLGGGRPAPARAAAQGSSKRVLFFTKSSGFEHPVIKRSGGKLALAERVLTEVGKEHGFEVVASKDGRLFNPDQIGQWDAFAFETTGDLTQPGTDKTPPMSHEGKQAFLDAIRAGKGFIGMHCATDTFHSNGSTLDPYIEMIGGEFIVHGEQQLSKLDVADESFPGARPFASSFKVFDEWYALKNFQDDLHVILTQNTEGMEKTKGANKAYARPNFPETWARLHGKGRVFYTSMGHREDVWETPIYQGLLIGALSWATGKVDANVEPNVAKVTPGYKQIPA